VTTIPADTGGTPPGSGSSRPTAVQPPFGTQEIEVTVVMPEIS
jgi:hypothetical protein